MKPLILVVDDQESIVLFLENTLVAEGYVVQVAADALSALAIVEQSIPDLVLLDLMLPDKSGLEVLSALHQQFPHLCIVMMTAYSETETAVRAMKLGAYDYVEKPIRLQQLLLVIQKGLAVTRSTRELYLLQRQNDLFRSVPDIVPSRSPCMIEVYDTVRKVASGHGTTVLIDGESGVGKDVIANIIHQTSARQEYPFLEINCASLPEQLLESELFGHEKGSFTDATQQKLGLLELAHKGTLFLDEIGEMSVAIQVKLLRVLEKMTFRRLGGLKDISVDVRVLAATNRNLDDLVAQQQFREDLYFRLRVVLLRIPPLRQRREDILPLAKHFLLRYSALFNKKFDRIDDPALTELESYSWPGNIRELKNVIERAVLLEEGTVLEPRHLQLGDGRTVPDDLAARLADILREPLPEAGIPFSDLVATVEEALVRKAYAAAGGNQSEAARLLQLNRDKLRYRLKSFGIKA